MKSDFSHHDSGKLTPEPADLQESRQYYTSLFSLRSRMPSLLRPVEGGNCQVAEDQEDRLKQLIKEIESDLIGRHS